MRLRTRDFLAAVLGLLALSTLAVQASAPARFGGFHNGSFDQGFQGWRTEAVSREVGQAFARTLFTVDGSMLGAGGDHRVAGLHVAAIAGSFPEASLPGTAYSRARLEQRVASIPSTTLSFNWAVGFGGTLAAMGEITFGSRVVVRRIEASDAPLTYERYLLPATLQNLNGPCGQAVAFHGFIPYRPVAIDLEGAGFLPGDDVMVTVEFGVSASAPGACDYGEMVGSLMVDRFCF